MKRNRDFVEFILVMNTWMFITGKLTGDYLFGTMLKYLNMERTQYPSMLYYMNNAQNGNGASDNK